MGMGFAPTWLRQVTRPHPLLHMTTLTTEPIPCGSGLTVIGSGKEAKLTTDDVGVGFRPAFGADRSPLPGEVVVDVDASFAVCWSVDQTHRRCNSHHERIARG